MIEMHSAPLPLDSTRGTSNLGMTFLNRTETRTAIRSLASFLRALGSLMRFVQRQERSN